MTNDYILADDLSGALEAGAAFRLRGRHVSLRMGDSLPPASAVGALTLVSSATRNADPTTATAAVQLLLAEQQAAGAQLLFKKIDSTLRGPVAAEIKALVDELAPPLVVVCPATPTAGRTMRDGVLLVHGVPVAETEFRNDPGWPVRESDIANLLANGGVAGLVRLSLERLRSAGALDSGCNRGVLVCDAETDADLSRLVSLVRQQEPRAIFVGAGGLAQAIAASEAGSNLPPPSRSVAPKTGLFVSGSMSGRSRRQLELLNEQCSVPLHEVSLGAEGEHTDADLVTRSLVQGGFAALTMSKEASAADSSMLLKRLTAVVGMLAKTGHSPEMLGATGGETAQALCAVLEIVQLDLVGESEPGVVIATTDGRRESNPRWLIIKPGGFGSDAVWVNMLRRRSE